MKYNKKKALAIIERYELKTATLRVWKLRGTIPDRYAETEERINLPSVLATAALDRAVEKYGQELQRLLETRQFKPGQKDSYYSMALISLCRECETYQKKGKLS
jgi:hypothetical protein